MSALHEPSVWAIARYVISRHFNGLLVGTALAAVAALTALLSSANVYLPRGLDARDPELAAISQRAEQMRAFADNIRNASYSPRPKIEEPIEVPFGGAIGSAREVDPGARLKLGHPAFPGAELQVVSVDKVAPSLVLSNASTNKVDLLLVTGRLLGAAGQPLLRFLVTVTPEAAPEKPANPSAPHHQTL